MPISFISRLMKGAFIKADSDAPVDRSSGAPDSEDWGIVAMRHGPDRLLLLPDAKSIPKRGEASLLGVLA